MTTLKEEILGNGLRLQFSDESNRYFGDYHRVCVVATITCDLKSLPQVTPEDQEFHQQALMALGEQLSIVKRFERMGVSSADVEAVRAAMIKDFLQHASPYLSRPDYMRSLVAAELNKRSTRCFYG